MISKLESGDAEALQDMFGKDLVCVFVCVCVWEYLGAESLGKQFAQADVYDNAKMNLPNAGKGFPVSRSKDNARIAHVQNRHRFPHQERANGEKGNVRNANVTNGEEPTRENDEGLEKEEYCE